MSKTLRQEVGVLTAAWNGVGDEVAGSCVTIACSDAGSVLMAVAGTPSPNVVVALEGYDGTRWCPRGLWDPSSTSPLLTTIPTITTATTRTGNLEGFSSFRVRCQTYTADAAIILTVSEGVISVPPMLGGTQRVNNYDITGQAQIASISCAISAAGENATMIGTATTRYLHSYHICNNGAAMAYVKLYATATTPTSGSTPQLVIGVPAGGSVEWSAGGGFGMRFNSGLGLRTTTGIANTDAVGVALNQLAITIGYN